jgi:glycosyltransferase involved in cell wall biosynthesis
MWGKVAIGTGIAAAALAAGSARLREEMVSAGAQNRELFDPGLMGDFISVNVCTLNEEDTIAEALESIRQQDVFLDYPGSAELIVIDSASTDRTAERAAPYADRILQSPRGKLTARHIGIKASRGTIIVNYDADVRVPPGAMNALLRHFKDPNVIAVTGPTITPEAPWWYSIIEPWGYTLEGTALGVRRIVGRNSAFRKAAYYDSGGFNRAINQQDRAAMIDEEEFTLARRMKDAGVVIYEPKACVLSSRLASLAPEKYRRERADGERF